jgi:acetyl coenzyme A synthetase (ADP forming)-like protein
MSVLDPLFSPRSIAVVGASRDPDSIGATVFHNLLLAGFAGPVYPVNPRADHVASVHAWPTVEAIPGPVDLAILLVPAPYVVEAARACGEKGVRAIIVISAGFGEIPGEGAAREAELVQVVRHYGMRMVGPNCLGVLNTDPAVRMNATFAPSNPPAGRVAFSSQSGALGVAIIDKAVELGIGISQFVSVGNKADVAANDLLEHWERDPRTQVVLLYLESFGNARRFAQVARRVSRTRPIVAVKSGRTGAGARAASSHTGALANSERGVSALLRHTGIIRVDTVEELFDTAMLVANQPLPAGPRVAVVTNAGGPGILATDACVAHGLEMAALSEATRDAMRKVLPREASVANPVDMIASAGPEAIYACLDAALADPACDAVIALFVPPGKADTAAVARAIVEASDRHPDKPVLTCFMGTHGVPAALRSLQEGHVPSYSFPEAGVRALARVVDYARWLEHAGSEVPVVRGVDADRARAALESVEPGGWLGPDATFEVLAAYGIRAVQSRRASGLAEVVRAAEIVGYPVVLKAEATGLVHKSDKGGVLLDLRDRAEVEGGYTALAERFGAALQAVLVQPLVSGDIEVICGVVHDRSVGPLIMFGMGGIHVELLGDVAFALHPLTEAAIADMPEQVRAAKLLDGFRGRPPGDRAAIADVLRRINQLTADQPELGELDLNPIKVLEPGAGAIVVDARIRRRDAQSADLERPKAH